MLLVAQRPHIIRILAAARYCEGPLAADPLRPLLCVLQGGCYKPLADAQRRAGLAVAAEEGRTCTQRVVRDKRPRALPPRARPTVVSVLDPPGGRRAVSRGPRGRANSVVWIDAGGAGGSCGAASLLLGALAEGSLSLCLGCHTFSERVGADRSGWSTAPYSTWVQAIGPSCPPTRSPSATGRTAFRWLTRAHGTCAALPQRASVCT